MGESEHFGKVTYRYGAEKLEKEWVELLQRPRVMKRNPKLEDGAEVPIMTLRQPRGICSFIMNLPPGGTHHKHGHMYEAVFYILEGKGYEIHDGKRYEWEAGDAAIVHPGGCVHQHFNADPERPARAIIFLAGPAYDSINLIADGLVETPYGQTVEELYKRMIWREGASK